MKSITEQRKNRLLQAPKSVIIETTALEFAMVFWDAGRSAGATSKMTQKAWARKNFPKFIPKAVEHLTSMLGRTDIADLLKQQIHEALLERINDPEMQMLDEMHLKHTNPTEH